MPSLDEVVAEICRMPLDPDGRSHVDLLERTGYLDHRGELTVQRVSDYLADDPALVVAWQGWCEDNRSTPGWFFRASDSGGYEVGHLARDGSMTIQIRSEGRQRACAEYVVREAEQLAGLAEARSRPLTALRKRLRSIRRP